MGIQLLASQPEANAFDLPSGTYWITALVKKNGDYVNFSLNLCVTIQKTYIKQHTVLDRVKELTA